ncbi:MAG: polysaccharide biosynthesis C-terminal domain-containing protein [Lachnospiraceae bacterium]|nr:polysaccharide biosynthesis C-terminal domain-containing protein [Lachnospiraceae bacterium]
MHQNDKLIKEEYLKLLFPIMFSVLGGTINAIIDSVFVSSRLGGNCLAAVNISMPIYLILCTLGSLFSYGCYFLSAKYMGRTETKKAEKFYHSAIFFSLVTGIVIMILGLIFVGPISDLLANKSAYRDYVKEYCTVIFAGSVPFIICYVPSLYLHLEAKKKDISITVAIMVAVDVILDYLFLYPLNMGMKGAALASVLAVIVSTVYSFYALERGVSNYSFSLSKLRPYRIKDILEYGSVSSLGNLYDAIKLICINHIILNAMGATGSHIWAVINTLSELTLIISTGVSRTGAPMLSVFNTGRENGRIRSLVKLECEIGVILSAIFGLILFGFNDQIEGIFSLNNNLAFPIACLGISTVFSTIGTIIEVYLNAIGKNRLSNVMVCLRRLVFIVLAALMLSGAGSFIWLFLVIGSILPILAYLVIAAFLVKGSKKTDRPLSYFGLLDDILERENKVLDFSIKANVSDVCDASEKILSFCEINGLPDNLIMKLGLSIEELLTVIIDKEANLENIDLRVFCHMGVAGINVRCAGFSYNPFEDTESDDDYLIGIDMLRKMAEIIKYSYTLGLNTISIMFEYEEEKSAG